ncbi:MAG: 16S rRNA (guanine(966)-N(2))-methyltransferase RsmD, partial [Candidatus Puniceispirillaceae bacterium]
DAPYQTGGGQTAVAALARIGALASGAIIIIETAKTETLESQDLASGLSVIDQRSYGKALLHFLTYDA